MQKPLRKHSRTSRAPGGMTSYRSVIRQDASRVRATSLVYGAAANLLIPIHRLATLHEPAPSFARFIRVGSRAYAATAQRVPDRQGGGGLPRGLPGDPA